MKNLALVCLLSAALLVATVVPVSGATIEVSGATHMTANAEYDRNPSIVYDGSDYWLFWTKGDDTSTAGVRGVYNPDADTYVVYYKTADTLAGLATATETKLALSETARPAGFDQRVVSATYFGGDIYAFASSGQSGTDRGLHYYKWDGVSWAGPTTLIADATARGGHVNVTSDASHVYIVWEATADASSDCYTWDGTTLSAKIDISTDNQPKIALMGTMLYVVSIEDGTGDIEAYSAAAGAVPSFSAHSTPVPGASFYDPCVFTDGTDLYVVTAPYDGGNDQQYMIQTVYSGGSWSTVHQVTLGGYGGTYWWDYWPCGYHDGSDPYVFFTTETASPSYSDGEIAMLKMDWDLGNDHYCYVQNAVGEALSGDDLAIATGTYREQIKIDGKTLDLSGAGIGSTIIEAVDVGSRTIYNITQWTGPARPIDACIGVVGPATVDISDLTVDGRELGPNNFYGIHFFDTSGSVTGCRIEDILYAADPGQSKVVSLVATHSVDVAAYTIDFSGNVIPNFQKGGILFMGPYITFTVDDNEITNVPSTIIAGNGIQLSYGATGTTSGNIVHGVGYAGDDWSATGILLFESGDVSMDGDVVHACESGVNYSNWGWIYSHPSVVDLSFADLLLYDNEWALSAQLSADNADLTFAADGCVILDSTGDGIDLYGTDIDPWGGSYYTGWDNGDLIADITDCVITGTALDGIWVDDYSGNSTNTMDVEVHYTALEGSVGSGLWNSSSYLIDAEYCWWGDPTGPAVIPEPPRGNQPASPPVSPYGDELPEQGAVRYAESSSSRAADGVHGLVDYTPWLTGNIVCDPDPEYLTATDPVKTIDVDYLGGGSGLMYGYSLVFTWDGAIVSTAPVKVTEGTLLSDEGTTFFYARTTGTNEITVDGALLGAIDGVTGPGTMFSIEFTGLAVGTSDVDITVDRVRDKDNNTLTGFAADDGLLIVDVSNPTVTDVLITNDTLGHTNAYIKDTDQATVTANVSDDDPAFGLANIVADLTGLGGGAAVNPTSYSLGVATWTLPSVTCLPQDGTVTVTVTATDPIGNTASDSDDITSDNTAPLAVTGFDASPAHEECVLTWTNGYDLYFAGVVVQRDAVGSEYPQYPWFVANWPSVDTGYPGSESLGTNVYNGSGTSYTDGFVARNIYYYQAFCYDIARNYGPADAGARDLATNYWLGDVADGWGGWGYDGNVDDDDILKLSGCYGATNPVTYPGASECDVGPTVHPDWHRLGLPLPDDDVEFEDLMVFAMNYEVVAPRVVPFLPEEYDASPLAVTLGAADGSDVSVALRLEGNVSEIKGVSAAVSYDPSELAFVSARLTDDMLSPIGEVFFWFGEEEGRVLVDVAVLGTGVTVGGSGDLAILTFRSLAGDYQLEVESARLRDVDNVDLDARLGDYASGGDMPTVFRLVQNAPNPFNPVTKVAYHVPRKSEVTIRVYDVSGRVVRTLVDGMVEPGRHAAVWNGRNEAGESVGSGIYFCTMDAPDFHDSRKMTLLK